MTQKLFLPLLFVFVLSCMQQASTPFSLRIDTPKEGDTIYTPSITVTGKTTPTAIVKVNDIALSVDDTGKFSDQVPIPDEENSYSIMINASFEGRTISEGRTIIYKRLPVAK